MDVLTIFWRRIRKCESATTFIYLGQDQGLSPCFINAVLCGAECHAPLLLQLITVVYTNILQTVNQQLNLIIYLIAPFSVILQPLTTHEPMFRLTTAPATPLTTAPPRARPAAPGVLSCHYPTLPLTQPLQPINTHNLHTV